MTTVYVVSDTDHPVGPFVFRHVHHPSFNHIVYIVGVRLLTERSDEQKVEWKMSSGRFRVAVVHHSFVHWRVTFHHKETVVNEFIII